MNATVLFEVVNETDISFRIKKNEGKTSKGNSVVRRNIDNMAFKMGAEEIKGQHCFMLHPED